MLKIQRASAGSGKTFTLARTYITLFLTIREPDSGRLRLRTEAEISDSLQHILAVTFTNKATAEMKDRIVEKLAAIAKAPLDTDGKGIDYLRDIASETGTGCRDVVEAARKALRVLLLDYSSFNISTIDSFFQTILRTFAYETDLNDSYQLELDDELTATAGVDETLDQMLSGKASADTRAWIAMLMDESLDAGGKWNPFQRRRSGRNVYTTLISNARKMGSEEFKMKREELEEYFRKHPDLYSLFREMEEKVSGPRKRAYAAMSEAASQLKEAFADHGIDLKTEGAANLVARLEKSLSGQWNPKEPTFKLSSPGKSTFKAKSPHAKTTYGQYMEGLYQEWARHAMDWIATYSSPQARLWGIYRKLLPYVPLLNVIGANIRTSMEQSNTMPISETNTLLKRIIGDDDTPFIYERLGTRINHYLIDEFQDTSRLQWDNFHPLLSESEGRDCANLIIGDAKQSIYRFRNADPSLITDVVPSSFPRHLAAGYSREENTNWRSCRRVVEFNNLFFHSLSASLGERFRTLYANVVQHPRHREEEGYVELCFYTPPSGEDTETLPPHILKAGEMVSGLLRRGYRQRDIAFLTRRREDANNIVEALMEYNRSLPDDAVKIEFISDQSLLVANSRAVQILVAALRNISRGLNPRVREGDEARRKGVADWREISARYSFMAARHPEMPPQEVVKEILDNPGMDDALADMIGGMQAVALPSLVESIIEHFVPEALKISDTPFLSAFQDAVLGYCDNNPSDIGSFLSWWERKADNLSITSPEDVDAVNIMTIHKSKGLEFDVVIIPVADMAFKPSPLKVEWGWVRPDPSLENAGSLPPWLPVEITSALSDTPHQHLWDNLEYLVAMDSLNMAYVGFTRAVRELYVYSPMGSRSESAGKFCVPARQILDDWEGMLQTVRFDRPDEHDDLPSGIAPEFTEGYTSDDEDEETDTSPDNHFGYDAYTFGTLPTHDEVERSRKSTGGALPAVIGKYHVNSNRSLLQYTEGDSGIITEGDDPDPRSIGNLMHDIMSRIRIPSDLDKAIRRLTLRGLADEGTAATIRERLTEALASVEEYGWFDKELRVINERPLIERGKTTLRPDRITVDRNGAATVVDYKFGGHEAHTRYARQVQGYMKALRATGLFTSVRGYLWYVGIGKVVEVPD